MKQSFIYILILSIILNQFGLIGNVGVDVQNN